MKKLILSCLAVGLLAGCASTPSSHVDHEPRVFATPAERAYQMGLEYRMIQGCRAELGRARVAQYEQSAELLLASYSASWRDTARSAFNQGFAAGPARFRSIPCEGIQAVIAEQIACNEAETRKNLKVAARLR